MAYTLVTTEYAYSDQSLRAWLELDAFGLDFGPKYVPMMTEDYTKTLINHAPAVSLPVVLGSAENMKDTIWDSAAAAEILAERHPEAGLWPQDLAAKETARNLVAAARNKFPFLQALPMNLHDRYLDFIPSDTEQQDANAVSALLEWALNAYGGPYLCGPCFCAADAAFAPIATRFVTYGLKMPDPTKAYVEAIYAHPSFRRWHACADAQLRRIESMHGNLSRGSNQDWPRQPVLKGKPYSGDVADALNTACPYSGLPIKEDSLAQIDGSVVGFCNPFCCRRGMADAESWPTVMAILRARV